MKEVARLLGPAVGGFYTEEKRDGNARVGFDVVTPDGARAVLSRTTIRNKNRVGRYGVDIRSFETIAIPAIDNAVTQEKTVVIDEIGKMELFSRSFRERVLSALESASPVLAVIMLKTNPFADSIKARADTKLIRVTPANRDILPEQLVRELGASV